MNKIYRTALIVLTVVSISWAVFLTYSVAKDNENKALFSCIEAGGTVKLSFEDLILNPKDYALVSRLSRKVWEDTKLTISLRNIIMSKFAPSVDVAKAYKIKCVYTAPQETAEIE